VSDEPFQFRSRDTPVVSLADAPGEHSAWDKSRVVVYLWAVCELLFLYNPWQISSSLRVRVLRAFGAEIGRGLVFRPRTRVKFPWKLHVADNCWIGEGVWIHNQDHVYIGHDVSVSQESFITTGSHAHRKDMALITNPVYIEPGAWITTRCVVLGGSRIGQSAIITPNTVVTGDVPPNAIWGGGFGTYQGERFPNSNN
jgi:putative colanic acid biosynthesis acetyltransferase WcaF